MEAAKETKFGTKIEDDALTSNTRSAEKARDTALDDEK